MTRISPSAYEVDARDARVLEVEERAVVRRGGGPSSDASATACASVPQRLVGRGLADDDDGAHRLSRSMHGSWPNAASAVLPSRPTQPVLAVVVVHREGAAGLEVVLGGLEGLLGEQVALQPQLRLAPATRVSESGSAKMMRSYFLSVRSRNARPSLMWTVTRGSWYGWSGFICFADLGDPRVDLHRVDVLGALGQRQRDVGAGAGADDEHVVERVRRRCRSYGTRYCGSPATLSAMRSKSWCGTPLTSMRVISPSRGWS